MKEKRIVVGTDFSPAPMGRDMEHFPWGGEAFRKKLLEPALREYDRVVVDLAEVDGYGSSFLDEAFAGLIRHDGYSADQLKQKLVIMSSDATLQISVDDALQDIEDAVAEVMRKGKK